MFPRALFLGDITVVCLWQITTYICTLWYSLLSICSVALGTPLSTQMVVAPAYTFTVKRWAMVMLLSRKWSGTDALPSPWVITDLWSVSLSSWWIWPTKRMQVGNVLPTLVPHVLHFADCIFDYLCSFSCKLCHLYQEMLCVCLFKNREHSFLCFQLNSLTRTSLWWLWQSSLSLSIQLWPELIWSRNWGTLQQQSLAPSPQVSGFFSF